MKIDIKVVTKAKKNMIKQEESGRYKVYVNAPAIDGKANKAVIGILAEFFGVSKSEIEIVRGVYSREKVVIIHK